MAAHRKQPTNLHIEAEAAAERALKQRAPRDLQTEAEVAAERARMDAMYRADAAVPLCGSDDLVVAAASRTRPSWAGRRGQSPRTCPAGGCAISPARPTTSARRPPPVVTEFLTS